MEKNKRILQVLTICLVMVSGIWIGMKIEHRQTEKHEEYLQGLNTAVAVVNQDLGVTINDASINYANAVIETLGSEYTVVSASAAQRGFEDGTYGAIITFPADFSSSIVSINNVAPRQASLGLSINPNLPEDRYIPLYTQLISVQQQVNNSIAYAYVETVYEQFHAAQDEITVLLENDETDMAAVRKVGLTNYTEMLDLGDMPQVGFEPSSPDFEAFLASAQSIADDMNQVYVSSYSDAQADFAIIKGKINGYETAITDNSERWTSDMNTWADNVAAYAQNVSAYKQTLDEWRAAAEEYHTDETQYVNGVSSFAAEVNSYLNDQQTGLSTTRSSLQSWRESILLKLDESNSDIEVILADAESISENALLIGNNISAYNSELSSLEIWLTYLRNYQDYLDDPDNNAVPEWPSVGLPQQLSLAPLSGDIAAVETDMRTHLKSLEDVVSDEISAVPAVPALEEEPVFDLPAPAFPDLVPNTSVSAPTQTAPEQPNELTEALSGIVSTSAGYNPNDYLNEQTRDDAQKSIAQYAGYLSGVESALSSNNAENLSKLTSIYMDYNTYIGQLRTNVFDVHNREQTILNDSITGLTNTLNYTSVLNHGIMDSFVSRMPNSRLDSTVNQQVVEDTVKPVTYSYDYIRSEANGNQNHFDTCLLLIILALIFIIIVDTILLVRKSRTMKREE